MEIPALEGLKQEIKHIKCVLSEHLERNLSSKLILNVYLQWKSTVYLQWIFSIITPLFSVTWSFRNQSHML